MKLEVVYVTVGTTKFESLICAVTSDEVLTTLKSRGCRQLILQLGTGQKVDTDNINNKYGINVKQYDFDFENARTIIDSSLIIGHAGAGTCMDVLKYQKPSLIVTNNELMDNHQTELASALASEGYIYFTNVKQLATSLETLDFTKLKPYGKETHMKDFVQSLNELMKT